MTGYLFIKFKRPSGNRNIETHQVTAIIEEAKPNCFQYYRTRGLHKNYHGWINQRDLKAFTGWHDSNGFERVTGRQIGRGYLPRKYYIICRNHCNYHLQELIVYNTFSKMPRNINLCNKIPWMKIAHMMVIDEFEKLNNETCNKKNARDNLCLHAGFTPVSSTDKLTVPGLSIPRQLIQCKSYEYLSLVGDEERDDDCSDEKDEDDSSMEGDDSSMEDEVDDSSREDEGDEEEDSSRGDEEGEVYNLSSDEEEDDNSSGDDSSMEDELDDSSREEEGDEEDDSSRGDEEGELYNSGSDEEEDDNSSMEDEESDSSREDEEGEVYNTSSDEEEDDVSIMEDEPDDCSREDEEDEGDESSREDETEDEEKDDSSSDEEEEEEDDDDDEEEGSAIGKDLLGDRRGDNLTMQDTMKEVMAIATAVCDQISEELNVERAHNVTGRNKHFGGRLAQDIGESRDAIRADACTLAITGPKFLDNAGRSVQEHVDKMNDTKKGSDDSVCINKVVNMQLPGIKTTCTFRIAFIMYCKSGCGKVHRKRMLLERPLNIIRGFMKAHPALVDGVQEGIVPEKVLMWSDNVDEARFVDEERNYLVKKAHADKSVFYSYVIEVIETKVKGAFGDKCKYVIYEAIYSFALSNGAVEGWERGVDYAIKNKDNGKNFIMNWIDGMVQECGHIGGGRFNRFMNSRNRNTYKVWDIYVSLYNLMRVCESARYTNKSTKNLLKEMVKTPTKKKEGKSIKGEKKTKGGKMGKGGVEKVTASSMKIDQAGLYGVGKLQAQQLLYLLTACGLMTDTKRYEEIGVAEGTETYKRLMKLGVGMKDIEDSILIMLSHELGIPSLIVMENLLCEALRWHFGKGTTRYMKYDFIGKDKLFYKLTRGKLYVGKGGGTMIKRKFPKYDEKCDGYEEAGCKWWLITEDKPERILTMDVDDTVTVSNN